MENQEMGTAGYRRIVDALDALAGQLRVHNQIEALKLASALDYDDGGRARSDSALARVGRQNALRAAIVSALVSADSSWEMETEGETDV
jgi:hypothetical protein